MRPAIPVSAFRHGYVNPEPGSACKKVSGLSPAGVENEISEHSPSIPKASLIPTLGRASSTRPGFALAYEVVR